MKRNGEIESEMAKQLAAAVEKDLDSESQTMWYFLSWSLGCLVL